MHVPNWSDPRVQRRLVQAIKFACFSLSREDARPFGKKWLDQVFGQQQNELSMYLRNELLKCVDHSYSFIAPGRDGNPVRVKMKGAQGHVSDELFEQNGPLQGDSKKYIRGPGYARLLQQVDIDRLLIELEKNGVSEKLAQIIGCANKHELAEKLRLDQQKLKNRLNLEKMLTGEQAQGEAGGEKTSETTPSEVPARCNTLELVCVVCCSGEPFEFPLLDRTFAMSEMQDRAGVEIESGQFLYRDSSHRLWHSLQCTKSEHKLDLWSSFGYTFNYDIAACAPTLLYQLARNAGLKKKTPVYDDFLADHRAFRKELQMYLGLECRCGKNKVKRAVNSLFNGAQLRTRPYWQNGVKKTPALLENLGKDGVQLLKANARVRALVKDIAACWKAIKESHFDMPVREVKSKRGNYFRKASLNGGQKWNFYFKHERQILEVARAYCAEHKLRVFCEHDGWRTDGRIDVTELEARILAETGFSLKIKEENGLLT